MVIEDKPTTSKNSSHASTSQLKFVHETNTQMGYVAQRWITLRLQLLFFLDAQATTTNPFDITPIVVFEKPFTPIDIHIIYSDRVLQSDSKMDSHEYEWVSLDSYEFEEDSLDTFEDKRVEGEAWIKTFWDSDIEDTSRKDRSPLKPDYKEESTDDDLNTSILTIIDSSYEINLIDEEIPIIHPKLIN